MTSQSSAKTPLLTLALAALCACDPSDDGAIDPDTDGGSENGSDESDGSDGGSTDGGSDDGVDESSDSDGGSDGSDGGEGPEHEPYTGDYELESVDVASTLAYLGDVAVAVGDDGDVHIAFTERPVNDNFQLRYAHRPFGSDGFETTTLAPLVHDPVEVFVDTDNRPCVVSVQYEDSLAAPSDLTMSCREGDGSWQDEVVAPFAGALSDTLDLDLYMDQSGEPALFYAHPNTGDMTIARRADGAWTMDTISLGPDILLSHANAIAIDSNDEVHVAMFGMPTVDPSDPAGVYYVGPDDTVAFGAALGSNASADVDLVLLADDAPLVTRADGSYYTLAYDGDGVPFLAEQEHPDNILEMSVRYDPVDDVTFRTYNIGVLGFDVRQGGDDWTSFTDSGSGAWVTPAVAHGLLHLVHWEGGGVPPKLRLTVATPS